MRFYFILTLSRTTTQRLGRRGDDHAGIGLQDQLTVEGQHDLTHVDAGGRHHHRDQSVLLEHGHVHGRRDVSRVPVAGRLEVHVRRPLLGHGVHGTACKRFVLRSILTGQIYYNKMSILSSSRTAVKCLARIGFPAKINTFRSERRLNRFHKILNCARQLF